MSFEDLSFWIRQAQTVVWFILIGFLIYLILKTQLTHIKDFRNRFGAGILVLLFTTTIFSIARRLVSLTPEATDLFYVLLYIFEEISMLIILSGTFKLEEYIYSIVGTQERTKKLNILFASLPGPIFVFILNIFVVTGSNGIGFTQLLMDIVGLPVYITFYFISIYCFIIHRDMKLLKIDMMMLFGIGFIMLIAVQILSLFVNVIDEGLFWVIFTNLYIAMIILLIVGYLNFKNQIRNKAESLK